MDSNTAATCANCHKDRQPGGPALQHCSRCRSTCYCSPACQTADWKSHKKTCSKPPRPTKVILLSLEKVDWFDDMRKDLLEALRSQVELEEITQYSKAMEYLAGTSRHPVIFSDAAFASENSTHFAAVLPRQRRADLKSALARFVEDGGVLILALGVPNFATPPDLAELFADLSLPWKTGEYSRSEFKVNKSAHHVDTSSLVVRYSQKCLRLVNVEKKDAVYLPTPFSQTQSMVFAPAPIDPSHFPAVFRASGKGWVGYVGDVNAEQPTTAVVLAMCGLAE